MTKEEQELISATLSGVNPDEAAARLAVSRMPDDFLHRYRSECEQVERAISARRKSVQVIRDALGGQTRLAELAMAMIEGRYE
jgi:hypothetical protein